MTASRFWPLERGRIVTSPFGPREGGFHYGVDFGFPGGSGGRKVAAISDGIVKFVGAAQGYGGPDPHGWIVVESNDGTWEYGHITRLPNVVVGSQVSAGQVIATINPDRRTNGGTSAHLHLSWMPGKYSPSNKLDPMPLLAGSKDPDMKGGTVERPDFNEYWVKSPNSNSRNNTRVDLWLIHTQEGGSVKDGADNLARWMQGPVGVSYHYTISQDLVDGGVTVCDVVDTDRAAWSVLDANSRSISLCFAGSRVAWSTDQWMKQSRAIDVAAYLAVEDAKKYGFPAKVIAPPYNSGPPGISDHAFVTKKLGIGTHSDVGRNFPWTFFAERVAYWSGQRVEKPPPVVPQPQPTKPVVPVGDPMLARWNCLGGQTVVEALAEIRDKVIGTSDRGKAGFE